MSGVLAVAWRVWRNEGPAAFRDRILDHLAEARRRRSFTVGDPLALSDLRPADLPETPVINLLATAPRPGLGGVPAQLMARLAAEARRRAVALLYPIAGGWRLEVTSGADRRAAIVFGDRCPEPLALRDPAFADLVRWALATCRADVLHVETVAGLPLAELPDIASKLVVSTHDFAFFCPRPHLFEPPRQAFCGFCRDNERCARCLRLDWPTTPVGFQAERRRHAAELLAAADAVVHPSYYLRREHLRLFPDTDPTRHHVVAPALTPPPPGEVPGTSGEVPGTSVGVPGTSTEGVPEGVPGTSTEGVPEGVPGTSTEGVPGTSEGVGTSEWVPGTSTEGVPGTSTGTSVARHIALLGGPRQHKGAALFAEALDLLDADAGLRFTVLGGAGPDDADLIARLRRHPPVVCRGYYRAGTLPRLLRRLQIDLALLLTVVPESYGLALDECRLAGVPVIALDHGAVGERLRADGGGLLLPASATPRDLAAVLVEVARGDRRPEPLGPGLPRPEPGDAADAVAAVYAGLGASPDGQRSR